MLFRELSVDECCQNATHAFTNPESTETGKKFNMPIEYNAEADMNSWNDMKLFFTALFRKGY